MNPSLKNPFEGSKRPKHDDASMLGKLLGEEAEAEMREDLAEVSEATRRGENLSEDTHEGGFALSEEEAVLKKTIDKESTPEQRREQWVEWAYEIERDEDWVDEIFTFNDDGMVQVEGSLELSHLERVTFPPGLVSVGRSLHLSGLTTTEGLKLPEKVGGDLGLAGLKSAKGLKFPEKVGGVLYLNALTSVEGLNLPSSVKELILLNLKSAAGLNLPESFTYLDLRSLSSIEGLKLPEKFEGTLYIARVPLAEKEELKKRYPNLEFRF